MIRTTLKTCEPSSVRKSSKEVISFKATEHPVAGDTNHFSNHDGFNPLKLEISIFRKLAKCLVMNGLRTQSD